MYGSSDRYRVLISTCPSSGTGTGAGWIVKFSAVGHPNGREASRIWRFSLSAMSAAYASAHRVTAPVRRHTRVTLPVRRHTRVTVPVRRQTNAVSEAPHVAQPCPEGAQRDLRR